jgi:hypothetical protein
MGRYIYHPCWAYYGTLLLRTLIDFLETFRRVSISRRACFSAARVEATKSATAKVDSTEAATGSSSATKSASASAKAPFLVRFWPQPLSTAALIWICMDLF